MRVALIMIVGCSGAPVTRVPPPVPADAAVDSMQSTLDVPVTAVDHKPVKLAEKTEVTLGGVTIKFLHSHHKHRADNGPTDGIWTFELVRGDKQQSLELRDHETGFEAEVDALGVALVFRHVDYYTFEVT